MHNFTKKDDIISIVRRNIDSETIPENGKTETFNSVEAININAARLNHLKSLKLSLNRKRVLDVGCGIGHLSEFFSKLGCEVLAIDGRKENINELRKNHPGLKALVFDLETDSFKKLGKYEIVFAYGILYHLENPVRAIRNLSSVCRQVLVLETIICDSNKPIVRFDDETKAYNQSMTGIGCRPSPSFLAMALNRAGFTYVYTTKTRPNHQDFIFSWKNNLDCFRDDHPLRCVFIASFNPLGNKNLIPLLKD